jgi:hypothetical protein
MDQLCASCVVFEKSGKCIFGPQAEKGLYSGGMDWKTLVHIENTELDRNNFKSFGDETLGQRDTASLRIHFMNFV